MKITDRKTFLTYPEGTVFCPLPVDKNGCVSYDIGNMHILDEHDSEHEYYDAKVGSMHPAHSDDFIETMLEMETGAEMEFRPFIVDTDITEDHSKTLYAIFSKEEVRSVIEQLQDALRKAY